MIAIGSDLVMKKIQQRKAKTTTTKYRSCHSDDSHCGPVTPYGSTMAQVMACCLTAPSHYLSDCWLLISRVQWYSPEGNFIRDTPATNHWNLLENYISEISFKSPWGQWIKISPLCTNIVNLVHPVPTTFSQAASVFWRTIILFSDLPSPPCFSLTAMS